MDEPKPNGERRFWGSAAKHFSLGGSVVMLAFMLKPYFFTRGEGVAQTAQIEELKAIVEKGFSRQESMLFAHTTDEVHKHERMTDEFNSALKEEKSDRIREMSLVENLFKMKRTQSN